MLDLGLTGGKVIAQCKLQISIVHSFENVAGRSCLSIDTKAKLDFLSELAPDLLEQTVSGEFIRDRME